MARSYHKFLACYGLLLVALLPTPSFGHATQLLVAAPFSPPKEFLWVPPAFFATHILLFWWVSSMVRGFSWTRFATLFILSNLVPWIVGLFLAASNTAPSPGFGVPFPAFFGYGWKEVGLLFLVFNGFALVIHLLFMNSILNQLEKDSNRWRWFYLTSSLILYILFLSPYIVSGGLTHGWHGIYTHNRCRSHLHDIKMGLARHLKESGVFPVAKVSTDLEEVILVGQLRERYLAGRKVEGLFFCPIEVSFAKNPRPYDWNDKVSGVTAEQARNFDPETIVVSCRQNHYRSPQSVTVHDILAAYDKIAVDRE